MPKLYLKFSNLQVEALPLLVFTNLNVTTRERNFELKVGKDWQL